MTTSANSLRTLGCISKSHGLVYIQVPQVISDLIFSYDGKDFVPLVLALRFRDLRDVRGLVL